MSAERDPLLEAKFAELHQQLVDENFTSRVAARVKARDRRVLIGRLAIAALLLGLELLLDSPLQNSLGAITEMLGTTLIEIDDEWIAFALAPINSIAGLLGVGLLGIHFAYRRVFN